MAKREEINVKYDHWVLMVADCLQSYGLATKEQLALDLSVKKNMDIFEAYATDELDSLVEKKMYSVYLNFPNKIRDKLKEHGFDDSLESFMYLYELPEVDTLLMLPEDSIMTGWTDR